METSAPALDSAEGLAGKIGHQTLWPELRELCRRFDLGLVLEVGAGRARNRERDFFAGGVKRWITLDISRGAAPDVVASALALPFRAESFDTAVCIQMLEHVPDPLGALIEINRALRRGGRLVVSAPQTRAPHMEPNDFFRLTRHGLEATLLRAGFVIDQMRPCGHFFATLGHVVSQGAFHFGLHARHSRVRRFWRRRGSAWINRIFLQLDRRWGELSDGNVLSWAVLAHRP